MKDAALKADKMFVSEKRLADILIKISTSFTTLGTRETTELDKYVLCELKSFLSSLRYNS